MSKYQKRSYAGGTDALVLAEPMSATALSFAVSGTFTEWPTGATGPMLVTVDNGLPEAEKILCSAFAPLTGVFTVAATVTTTAASGRGYDGTAAVGHVPLASTTQVQLTWSAVEAREANMAVYETIGKVEAKGDLLYGQQAHKLDRLAVGTEGYVLAVGATNVLEWINPTASFGLNTTNSKIKGLRGSASAGPATTTLAAKASHVHKFVEISATAPIYGTVPGTFSAVLQVVAKSVRTDNVGVAHIPLNTAYTDVLISAQVMDAEPGGGAGYLYSIDVGTSSLSVVAINVVTSAGHTAVSTETLLLHLWAIGH